MDGGVKMQILLAQLMMDHVENTQYRKRYIATIRRLQQEEEIVHV